MLLSTLSLYLDVLYSPTTSVRTTFDIQQRPTFSILDSPPQITPPTLTLSFPYEAKIGTTLKDLFSSLKNNVTVRNARIKEVGGKLLDLENRDKLERSCYRGVTDNFSQEGSSRVTVLLYSAVEVSDTILIILMENGRPPL